VIRNPRFFPGKRLKVTVFFGIFRLMELQLTCSVEQSKWEFLQRKIRELTNDRTLFSFTV
jgi:hypothetical protein